MKRSCLLGLAFGLAFVVASRVPAKGGEGEDVQLSDCPAAVRKTIRAESRGGEIDSVSKDTEDGAVSYRADVVIGGKLYGIGVKEDGTLTEIGLQVDDHEIGLTDCPTAVQKTLREECKATKIEDVRRETRLGVTLYVTTIDVAGKQYDVKVAEDGTLTEKTLLIEEDEVDLAALPEAARNALRREAGGAALGTVTRSNGIVAHVYVSKYSAGDRTYEVEVSADGTLLSKTLEE